MSQSKTVLAILSIFILFALYKCNASNNISPDHVRNEYEPNSTNTRKNHTRNHKKQKKIINFHTKNNNKKEDSPVHSKKELFKSSESSRKKVRAFSKVSRLKMPNFLGYNFEDYSDETTATLVGKSSNQKSIITIVASPEVPNAKDVPGLLKKFPAIIPESDPRYVESISQPQKFPDRNGMKDITLWKARYKGKLHYITFGKRDDGKGSYLFSIEGPEQDINSNEGYYEKTFGKIKAE